MARSSVTVDLEEQLHSVKHQIWCLYPTGQKVRVLDERPNVLVRPSWRISYLTHYDEQITSRRNRQIVDWTIDYYGSNRMDVMDKLNLFEKSVKQGGSKFRLVNLIPVWRFDWQYPPVYPYATQGGTLAPATYQVRVSGIDLFDNESAASVSQAVVVADPDNAIGVRIPRVPYSTPLFKQFYIYINGHREGQIDLPPRSGLLYPQFLITDLLGTGPAPKEPGDNIRVRWMFLRVTGFAASSREDEIKGGVFTGNISLQTTIEQEHDRVQLPAVYGVGIDTSVDYDYSTGSDQGGEFTISIGV